MDSLLNISPTRGLRPLVKAYSEIQLETSMQREIQLWRNPHPDPQSRHLELLRCIFTTSNNLDEYEESTDEGDTSSDRRVKTTMEFFLGFCHSNSIQVGDIITLGAKVPSILAFTEKVFGKAAALGQIDLLQLIISIAQRRKQVLPVSKALTRAIRARQSSEVIKLLLSYRDSLFSAQQRKYEQDDSQAFSLETSSMEFGANVSLFLPVVEALRNNTIDHVQLLLLPSVAQDIEGWFNLFEISLESISHASFQLLAQREDKMQLSPSRAKRRCQVFEIACFSGDVQFCEMLPSHQNFKSWGDNAVDINLYMTIGMIASFGIQADDCEIGLEERIKTFLDLGALPDIPVPVSKIREVTTLPGSLLCLIYDKGNVTALDMALFLDKYVPVLPVLLEEWKKRLDGHDMEKLFALSSLIRNLLIPALWHASSETLRYIQQNSDQIPQDLPFLLCRAIRHNSHEVDKVNELLAIGANPNTFLEGFTPLMYAANFDKEHLCRLLLNNGALPNLISEDGRSALLLAAGDNAEIVAMLVEHVASVFGHCLTADPTNTLGYRFGACRNRTPLTAVCYLLSNTRIGQWQRRIELLSHLRLLLAAPSRDFSFKHSCECSPLHIAAYSRDIELLEILLSAGFDVNQASLCGSSPMAFAARTDCMSLGQYRQGRSAYDTVQFLLSKGAQAEPSLGLCRRHIRFYQVGCDVSPLQWASAVGDIETAKLLISNGADINASAGTGCSSGTALQQACREDQVDMVKHLIENGADVNAKAAASPFGGTSYGGGKLFFGAGVSSLEKWSRPYRPNSRRQSIQVCPRDSGIRGKTGHGPSLDSSCWSQADTSTRHSGKGTGGM